MQRIRQPLQNHSFHKIAILFALWWMGAEFSIVLAAGPAWAESEAKTPAPTWFTQTMAGSSKGLNVSYFWSSGAKFKSQTVMGGRPVVTIVSGDTYYAYDALTMKGVAIQRTKSAIAADDPNRRPFGNEFEIMRSQGAEKVREEKLAEALCDVYQITDDDGRRSVWVSQVSQLPLRVEVYERQSGNTRYKEFFDWRNNLPIDDAFFQPDSAIEFKRFSLDEYLAAKDRGDKISPVPILFGELIQGANL